MRDIPQNLELRRSCFVACFLSPNRQVRKFPAIWHASFFTQSASLGEAVSRAAVRRHRGNIVKPRRNLVNSYDCVRLAASEPAWNHCGAMQELCVVIWFRPACDVGTIVEPRRNLVSSYDCVILAASEPSWSHAGTMCFHMVSSCLRRRNHRGTKQEPCDFI